MIETEGIDHVALEVDDVERSAAWYRAVLGLERRFKEEWDGVPTMVGAGRTALALFPRRTEPGARSRGLRHIAFRVDRETFDRARRELPERGIEIEFSDHGVCHSIYFRDLDGYRLELTTYEV